MTGGFATPRGALGSSERAARSHGMRGQGRYSPVGQWVGILGGVLRRNVLIFHQAALGDFVVSWPLALALGRMYPQSRLAYVTAGEKGKLATRAIRTEAIDVEAGWHHLFGDAAGLPESNRKVLEN